MRLETGPLEFKISNRGKLQHHAKPSTMNTLSSNPSHSQSDHLPNRVFVRAHVDVNLSLGQLIRNMVFEEAESDYQQYAFFKTHIGTFGY